jgi:hypothetical protein
VALRGAVCDKIVIQFGFAKTAFAGKKIAKAGQGEKEGHVGLFLITGSVSSDDEEIIGDSAVARCYLGNVTSLDGHSGRA